MQIELAGSGWNSEWSERSDADFLASVAWKRGANSKLIQAAEQGNVEAFVVALAEAWKLPNESARQTCRALWTLPAIVPSERESALVASLTHELVRPKNKVVSARSKTTPGPDPLEDWWRQFQPDCLTPWEFLALLEAFPNRISRLTVATAFQIWRRLLQLSCDLNQLLPLVDRKPEPDEELNRYGFIADPFLDLSLFRNCELPWLAGLVLTGVKGAGKTRKHGAELLEHELVERTDDHGAPHAALIPRWSMWLAIYTRFITLSKRHGQEPWDDDAAILYMTAVERTAPLIQPDGRIAFSRVTPENPQAFIEEVLRTSGWSDAEAAINAMLTVPKRNGKSGSSKHKGTSKNSASRKKPLEICVAPVNQSDETAWAVLRTHWGADADRVTIDHDQPALNIEMMIQGQNILEGEWRSTLTVNNQVIPLQGEWSCVCWQSDPEADYIEIQLTLPGVARIERQVLLSRTEQFCLLSESLAELAEGEFSLESHFPLCAGVIGETNARTREVQLSVGKMPIRVFPVAAPDRHVFSTATKFTADLSLTTTVQGTGWYNPMLFDWSPARRTAPADWRSLTVAEDRTAVKPGVASGYRLRVGDQQWLLYRALLRTEEPRSVLGHQTRYETVIGTVEADGEITPLMLVE